MFMRNMEAYLVGAQIDPVCKSVFQLDRMETTMVITQKQIRKARACPAFNPRRYPLPGTVRQLRSHRAPKFAFSFYHDAFGFPLLLE